MFKPFLFSTQSSSCWRASAALLTAAMLSACGQQTTPGEASTPKAPARAVSAETLRAAELVKNKSPEDLKFERERAKKLNDINMTRFEKKALALEASGVAVFVDSREKALQALSQRGISASPKAQLHACSQQKCLLVFGELPPGTLSFKPHGVRVLTEGGRALPGNSVQVQPF